MKTTLWIVAYDIRDTKSRSKVGNILKDHGERIQYSVFECWLTEKELQGLRKKISEIINEDEDQVRWYPLCSWCVTKISWHGKGTETEDRGFVTL